MENNIYYKDIDDPSWQNMVKRRYEEAEGHWNKMGLKSIRAQNIKQYLGTYLDEQVVDERYEDTYSDNRQFTAVRTILPFLTARVTAAQVTPANGDDLSIQFAHDFEEVLQKHAEKQKARAKIRLAVQDVLKGQRVGILKWRFDSALNDVKLEYIKPNTITVGKRASMFEEPDFIRHEIERSVYELVRMFPDKKDIIYELFNIEKGVPSQLEKIHIINEDWLWVDTGKEKKLIVGFSYKEQCFGKIEDPNWDISGKNIIERPMMPFVFYNFFNDGSGYIDETSSIEQAKHLQKNYNKRGQTIAENAKYGGTGVPIFAKGSITQKDVAKIRFSPIQRVLLDTTDINKAFTTWQSSPLPQYIVEDKYDERNSIDNIWGTPNVFRGEQSDNNTLGQDVLIRNQAEGRLSDPVDAIDDAMDRFFQLEAQMFYMYFDENKFYNYLGEDGKFVELVVNKPDIAKNIGISISVKSGTSLPIDRAQKRQTVVKLLELNRVSTLVAYKELGLFDDPEDAYKQFLLEQVQPEASLQEVDKQVFDRAANQDLQLVIGGKEPQEREDISEEYVAYLNEWLLTDKYKMLQDKKPDAAAKVSVFIDSVIDKASRKADKLQMQPDQTQTNVPPEVAALMDGLQPGAEGEQQPVPPPELPVV
jgi:hypothetical protein